MEVSGIALLPIFRLRIGRYSRARSAWFLEDKRRFKPQWVLLSLLRDQTFVGETSSSPHL